jgi:protoporphyrinogen oxidase
MEKKIVIIGAGPTGLGAAYRLQDLGYHNWELYEQNSYVGGLSASFRDKDNYTWDLGGHVLFSHYEQFDRVVEEALGDQYVKHLRESWIYLLKKWIPYPFQNNLRYLPDEALFGCLYDLHKIGSAEGNSSNFKEWILNTFGNGIAKYFMIPYNEKVWSTDLTQMSHDWISERISVVDFKEALQNVILKKEDVAWGPNAFFKFPLRGGTGEIFRNIASNFKNKIQLTKKLKTIDLKKKTIEFQDGSECSYDYLISTIPINVLIDKIKNKPTNIEKSVQKLVSTKTLIVGLGFSRKNDSDKNWVYYPENINPCYRVTYLSNYSPNNVPDIKKSFSLMGEISFSSQASVSIDQEVIKIISGYQKVGLINESDTEKIQSTFAKELKYSYPVPTLDRDDILSEVIPYLEKNSVYSRGRFGYWKYEIGNMDHSFMQGFELIGRLLVGEKENIINS